MSDSPTFSGKEIAFVRDIYELEENPPTKFTVPILYDKKNQKIVNNESSEILRILNSGFQKLAKGKFANYDFYPTEKREEIDSINEWIYHDINNGVYKCGFATSQSAYQQASNSLYASLDRVEKILANQRYLLKGGITEADIRLFVTLARFTEVYEVYFKTNKLSLREYPNIRGYCRDMYQAFDGRLGSTINMPHIKTHYYTSHPKLNHYAVIPEGPNCVKDFEGDFSDRVKLP